MDDATATDYAARALGWTDYPDDSVECGGYWHTDPARAPFGHTIPKHDWNPIGLSRQAFMLMFQLRITIRHNGPWVTVSHHTAPKPIEMKNPENPEDLRYAITHIAAQIYKRQNNLTEG